MPSSTELVILLGTLLIVPAAGYAVYWALAIRRALVVRLYRNQALGIGLLGTIGTANVVLQNLLFIYDLQNLLAGRATPLAYAVVITSACFLLGLFYWIDASILSARRSDPLLRDTFNWRRVRYAFWALTVTPIVVLAPSSALLAGGPVSLSGAVGLEISSLVVAVAGVVVLPIAARRSGDMVFRRQLVWLGLFVAATFLTAVPLSASAYVYGPGVAVSPVFLAMEYLGILVAVYFAYRSARSLAPLNRIESG